MKAYRNLYQRICSYKNLELAFKKAKKNKGNLPYVIEFEVNLKENLLQLQKELKSLTYKPRKLKRFIIRDPKTRIIHSSNFRDRVIHHAIVNILEPIYEKIFVYDSYASRINKGSHKAVERFEEFKRKVSENNLLVRVAKTRNQIKGYVLKADIKKYFDSVDHTVLLDIISRNIKDNKVIWLIKQILDNFDAKIKGKGVPLGNLTSQFFANVYLNELDYFIKHNLKAKYYIRYVDDFVILHEDKEILEKYKIKIEKYLKTLKIELHPDKSDIKSLKNGITFLGYRIYGKHRLLRKSNLRKFQREFDEMLAMGVIVPFTIAKSLQGWFGYAQWANTYKLRKRMVKEVNSKILK
ncbi:reverse transcriptase/maturase family protein [archaeon]|nr:reverse transcriptase/maturase family protein [archaeon]